MADLMQPGTAGEDRRHPGLQYLRALGAVSVVVYHASHYLESFRGDGRFLAIFGGFFGAYGVAVFFALSGYLMAGLIERDTPAHFLVSRIGRIYPPLLLVTAASALAFVAIGQPRGFDLIALTLAPAGPRGYFLAVEWTLIYELVYYVVLSLLAFAGLIRFKALFALLWLSLIAISWVVGSNRADIATPTLSELPLGVVNVPFLLGLLLPMAARSDRWQKGLPVLAAALAVAAALSEPQHLRLLVGLSAPLLLAAVVRSRATTPVGRWGRIGVRLGDASYMLYLSHVVVFEIVLALVPATTPSSLLWAIWVCAAIGLSLPLGRLDLRLHSWVKARIAHAGPTRLNWVSSVFILGYLGIAVFAEIESRQRLAENASAQQILRSRPVGDAPSVRAEIDSVVRRPNGRVTIRGYGVDLDSPALVAHIAILQNGRIVAFDRMTRMRTGTAAALARPDLAKRRFGFSVNLQAGFDCQQGPLVARLILSDGRVAQPTGQDVGLACP